MSDRGSREKEAGPSVVVARLLLLAALAASLYLTQVSFSGDEVAGCAEGSSCDSVLSSKWSKVFGVPVAVTGLFIYLGLIVASFKPRQAFVTRILAEMVIGAAVWFGVVQAVFIKAFCPWCCATHALAATGAALLWVKAWPTTKHLPFNGLIPVGALAMVQFLSPEPAGGTKDFSTESVVVERVVEDAGRIRVYHEFEFATAQFPSLGDPGAAEGIVVGMFDYTCDHCVRLLGVMEEVVSEQEGKVALVMLPGHFEDQARSVHEIMLSLYREDPALYADIASAVHERAVNPKAEDVRSFLGQMLGEQGFEDMLARHREEVGAALDQAAEILKRNEEVVGMRKLPQLMLGETVVVGVTTEKDYYEKLLRENLGPGKIGE